MATSDEQEIRVEPRGAVKCTRCTEYNFDPLVLAVEASGQQCEVFWGSFLGVMRIIVSTRQPCWGADLSVIGR